MLAREFGRQGAIMNRYFVRTAAAVFCAAWAAGCGSTETDKPGAPTTASAAPRTSSDTLPTTMDGEIKRAHELRVAGSYDQAAKALGQLMLMAPDDARVVGEYGKVLTQLGRPGEALPFLNRAVQLNANDWTLYSALGVAYDQADQHTKARAAYEHALQLKPGQPDVLNNMGVSKMLAGDLPDAKKLLSRAAQPGAAQPEQPKIGNNLALLETMKPATGSPKALPGVVMQKVPADADAGRAADSKADPHKLAAKLKPAQPPTLRQQDSTPPAQPILRTAADGQ